MFAKEESLIPVKPIVLGSFSAVFLYQLIGTNPGFAFVFGLAVASADFQIRKFSNDESSLPSLFFSTGQQLLKNTASAGYALLETSADVFDEINGVAHSPNPK